MEQVSLLEEVGRRLSDAEQRFGPSVVGIGRGWGNGCGVVVAPGRILTSAHVLRGEDVAVTLAGETVHGRLAGFDPDLDVAVIAADTRGAPAITWSPAASSAVAVGTPVLALADPGGRGLRVTAGWVSSTGRSFRGPRGRRVAGLIEHTAPLPRGSSGGPLLDLEGRLLGLNAVRLEGGFILALPADEALKAKVDGLSRGQGAARPRLGVALAHPRAARKLRAAVGLPERDGLLVRAVLDDSPAGCAGIERGDLLVAAAGRELRTIDELFDVLETSRTDATLPVTIVRGTEEREVSVSFEPGETKP